MANLDHSHSWAPTPGDEDRFRGDARQAVVLKDGSKVWNSWREKNPDVVPSLKGLETICWNYTTLRRVNLSSACLEEALLDRTDFSRAFFYRANLHRAALRNANLSLACFRRADLSQADLRNSNLRDADLTEADLSEANLSEADLRGANLTGAQFHRTDLFKANLRDAELQGTFLTGVDLSEAKGLSRVRHHGPSIIAVDTLYASKARVPVVFLRGCGVPDSLITLVRSQARRSVEFHSCFISYSTRDEEFAKRLHSDLQKTGVRCWFAPHDVRAGKKLHEQIDEAIRTYDRLLLILSEQSMHSEWVKTEILHARQKELNERRQVLFPISLVPFKKIGEWRCFDADTGKDSARAVREYFIPDFSNWQDRDSYRAGLERLARDLKAKG
jgi:uncharacterized protein YjbI with pentapeptide repeats